MEIKSSKPVSCAEAKGILSGRHEEAELSYEQRQAIDHLEKFVTDEPEKARKLIAKLAEGGNISEESAIKIADTKPPSVEALKAILLKEKAELSPEEIERILKEIA